MKNIKYVDTEKRLLSSWGHSLSFSPPSRERERKGGDKKRENKNNYFSVQTLSILLMVVLLIIFHAPTLHAKTGDYDPITGIPRCINCHKGDKKPSIDYRRDNSCLTCHSTKLSNKFLLINSRYKKDIKNTIVKAVVVKDLENKSSDVNKGINFFDEMVYIPAGEFIMGSDDWWPKSQPEHKRYLKAFYIDKYEVTNGRYKRFIDATGRTPPAHWIDGKIPEGREKHPVVFVSWFDANNFCRWEGKRLPTEAEWEKAARGTDGRTFPWGNEFDAKKGNMPQLGVGDTMPVGSFPEGKSPYGVYDMAGNVFEWTASWFKPHPGNTHPDENYGEKYKVLKGGSWYDCTYYKCGISAPTYNRIFFNPLTMNNNFGFRCAKDAE